MKPMTPALGLAIAAITFGMSVAVAQTSAPTAAPAAQPPFADRAVQEPQGAAKGHYRDRSSLARMKFFCPVARRALHLSATSGPKGSRCRPSISRRTRKITRRQLAGMMPAMVAHLNRGSSAGSHRPPRREGHLLHLPSRIDEAGDRDAAPASGSRTSAGAAQGRTRHRLKLFQPRPLC